jgi:hypothetical protein
MEIQITKEEKRERLKAKWTTILGLPMLVGGLFMFFCTISFFIHKNPDLKFEWPHIILVTGWGYTFFSGKDTLLKGMIGLLVPSKK